MSTQIILSLAHLLHQHSPDYDATKNSLLDTTATLSMQTAQSTHNQVHVVLTGSPRPTFAETNAWLLQTGGPITPRKRSNTAESYSSLNSEMSADLQSYVKESQEGSSTPNANTNDIMGSPTKTGGSVLSRYRVRRLAEGDQAGGKVMGDAAESSVTEGTSKTTHSEPLVGQAVVNAIAQTKGIGLQSSRAKLLQGTIDRPLWDQRRWTDGECLFSDLVDRCGLESFANSSSSQVDADCAAGKHHLRDRMEKVSNLSAHLITVSPNLRGMTPSDSGMDDDTASEIARAILRFLKRKQSPPASKVTLIMSEEEKMQQSCIGGQLKEAWLKLEQYNDMIGQPKLLSDVEFEFVDA